MECGGRVKTSTREEINIRYSPHLPILVSFCVMFFFGSKNHNHVLLVEPISSKGMQTACKGDGAGFNGHET